MVNRVGNGPGYGYTPVNDKNVNTNANGTGEKFYLDYGKEGAVYEPSNEALKRQQAEKKAATKTQDNLAKAEEDGVKLTLSNSTAEKAASAESNIKNQSGSILDTVTNAVNKIIDTVKTFFLSIWNDEPGIEKKDTQELSSDTEIQKTPQAEKPKTRFEEAKAEAEAFLASTQGKQIAKNSDLLTYYDKHGTVVSVSPSDKQRILYGDKHKIEV